MLIIWNILEKTSNHADNRSFFNILLALMVKKVLFVSKGNGDPVCGNAVYVSFPLFNILRGNVVPTIMHRPTIIFQWPNYPLNHTIHDCWQCMTFSSNWKEEKCTEKHDKVRSIYWQDSRRVRAPQKYHGLKRHFPPYLFGDVLRLTFLSECVYHCPKLV